MPFTMTEAERQAINELSNGVSDHIKDIGAKIIRDSNKTIKQDGDPIEFVIENAKAIKTESKLIASCYIKIGAIFLNRVAVHLTTLYANDHIKQQQAKEQAEEAAMAAEENDQRTTRTNTENPPAAEIIDEPNDITSDVPTYDCD